MINLEDPAIRVLLDEAARRGAEIAQSDWRLYTIEDAAKKLHISASTVQRRVKDGKIKVVDGRITGAEIRRYLQLCRNI